MWLSERIRAEPAQLGGEVFSVNIRTYYLLSFTGSGTSFNIFKIVLKFETHCTLMSPFFC